MSYSYSYSGDMSWEQFRSLFGPYFNFVMIISFILSIAVIIATWKIFEKADVEGWKCLIPIYNLYKEFEIVTGSGWNFLLLLIPLVNIGILIWFYINYAKAFGQPGLFAVGLIFLSPVFVLILGFGSAEYVGPKGIPYGSTGKTE